jgi:hypothetical protein
VALILAAQASGRKQLKHLSEQTACANVFKLKPVRSSSRCRSAGADQLDGVAAGLLALPAGFRAEAAVLVHAGMPLALLGAKCTGLRAGLEGGDDHLLVSAGPAAADCASRQTDVCAIEVEADASPKLRDYLLRQACVGARRAALGAALASLNAADEHVVRVAADVGVSGNHVSHVVHESCLRSRTCGALSRTFTHERPISLTSLPQTNDLLRR